MQRGNALCVSKQFISLIKIALKYQLHFLGLDLELLIISQRFVPLNEDILMGLGIHNPLLFQIRSLHYGAMIHKLYWIVDPLYIAFHRRNRAIPDYFLIDVIQQPSVNQISQLRFFLLAPRPI